jgi:hypothetical protein
MGINHSDLTRSVAAIAELASEGKLKHPRRAVFERYSASNCLNFPVSLVQEVRWVSYPGDLEDPVLEVEGGSGSLQFGWSHGRYGAGITVQWDHSSIWAHERGELSPVQIHIAGEVCMHLRRVNRLTYSRLPWQVMEYVRRETARGRFAIKLSDRLYSNLSEQLTEESAPQRWEKAMAHYDAKQS